MKLYELLLSGAIVTAVLTIPSYKVLHAHFSTDQVTFSPTGTSFHKTGTRVSVVLSNGELTTFAVTDSPVLFKFNSSDDIAILNNAIQNKQTCKAEVAGIRAFYLSFFKRIVSLSCS